MNTPYSIYHGIEDRRKTFIAISRWEWAGIKPEDAIKVANKHFKVKKDALKCEKGYIIGDDLYIGDDKTVTAHRVWVITKK